MTSSVYESGLTWILTTSIGQIRLISNLAKNCTDPEFSKMFIEGAQETHVTSCDSLPNPSSYRLAGNRWLQNHQQLNNQG